MYNDGRGTAYDALSAFNPRSFSLSSLPHGIPMESQNFNIHRTGTARSLREYNILQTWEFFFSYTRDSLLISSILLF